MIESILGKKYSIIDKIGLEDLNRNTLIILPGNKEEAEAMLESYTKFTFTNLIVLLNVNGNNLCSEWVNGVLWYINSICIPDRKIKYEENPTNIIAYKGNSIGEFRNIFSKLGCIFI